MQILYISKIKKYSFKRLMNNRKVCLCISSTRLLQTRVLSHIIVFSEVLGVSKIKVSTLSVHIPLVAKNA